MKVGDEVVDKLYYQDSSSWRGKGVVVSLTDCADPRCECPGFVSIHWNGQEEPDEEGHDYRDDVEVIEESK
jgi:hypothetical protein